MQFSELNLIKQIQDALMKQGYSEATPIQTEAIPPLLEGSDLLGCAQTGTGKTAAFAIPILQNIAKRKESIKDKRQIRALIVAPTRELATQIRECFVAYGVNLTQKSLVIFGGVNQNPQTNMLKKGIDILVATPGRLIDLINQKYIDLSHVEHFVLDEADQMLDMGMLQDVRKIITHLPKERQNMLFSATMPAEIEKLADTILKNPVKIEITPEFSPLDIIKQEVYFVDNENKTALLLHLLKNMEFDSVLVFSKTKHGADKIVKELNSKGFTSVAIHGNKSQTNRESALNAFKERKIRILVATDIAARGLDIKELSHVINYNLPDVPQTYIHRIGRTGRAGLGGEAITFCDFSEKPLLSDIQKQIGQTLPEVKQHPYPLMNTVIEPKVQRRASSRPQRNAAKKLYSKPSDGRKTDKSPYSSSNSSHKSTYRPKRTASQKQSLMGSSPKA